MKWLRTIVVLGGLVLVLGMVNLSISDRETVLANGQQVLLQLRPVDPRSLMQGDYMILRYADVSAPDKATSDNMPGRGTVILKLDENNVATYSRLDDGTALQAGEFRMRYKIKTRHGELRYGAESFFFQEGDAELYEAARYGVLRVDDEGASVLVGLADENRNLIVRPATPSDGDPADEAQ